MTDQKKFYFIVYEDNGQVVKEGAVEVTELVKQLYDIVVKSIDWGSDMLSYEEIAAVAELAKLAGYEGWDAGQAKVADMLHSVESWEFQKTLPRRPSHGHIFVVYGEGYSRVTDICQIPSCTVGREDPRVVEDERLENLWTGRIPHEPVLSSVNRCMYPRHIKDVSSHPEES